MVKIDIKIEDNGGNIGYNPVFEIRGGKNITLEIGENTLEVENIYDALDLLDEINYYYNMKEIKMVNDFIVGTTDLRLRKKWRALIAEKIDSNIPEIVHVPGDYELPSGESLRNEIAKIANCLGIDNLHNSALQELFIEICMDGVKLKNTNPKEVFYNNIENPACSYNKVQEMFDEIARVKCSVLDIIPSFQIIELIIEHILKNRKEELK